MMGTWGRSTAMDTGDTLPPSEMPPPAPLGPPPRTDSLDQWAACFQAIKGFENSMEGAEEEEEPGNLDFSDMEDDGPPRPEALQRLLSNGHTALPTAPPAWSAQPSHPTPQPPAQMENWKPDLELIGSAKWGPSPSTAHNTCFESHTTASRMPAAETTTTATTTTGRPTTDYSMLTIQAPKNIVHPPSTAGQSSSAQTTPCGNNYDSDSDSGSSVASGGGGGGKITPSGGNSRKSGRRRTPADQERKRLKKNAREQRRANKINDQIANMRNILAESGVAVQSTKSSILYQAIELIRSLRGQIQDIEQQQQEAPPAQPRPSTTTLPPPSSPACMSRNISFEGKTALPSDSSAMLQDPMGFLAPEPYRLLFRKSATPLAIACLGPSGRFIDCNIRFAEVFGISVDDLRQCSILNFAAPIDEEQAHSVLMAATRPSSNGVREGMTTPAVPEAPLELILTNMQGHRYLVRVSPLKDDQGTPAYLLLTPKAIFRSPQHPPPPATTAATTGLAPPPFPHMMGSVPPALSAASSSSSSSFGSSSSLGSNVPTCPQPAPTMPAFPAHHM